MKIECQSCGAAYKIADEKVQGKKLFKIKCKKCGSDIVVRGTDAAEVQRPVEDEATRAMDTSGGEEPIWHVVLNGEQQGPYSIPQVREMLAAGNIDAETYVWRDGFEGWLPMQEVGELASAFGAPAPAEPEPSLMGNDLFASIAPPAVADAPVPVIAPAPAAASDFYASPEPSRNSSRPLGTEPAKARAKVGGGDLFATEARVQEASKPLFSGGSDVPPAASNGGGDSMTGQRNENSVLFSLATLQQLSGPKEAPAPSTAASGDSSGLIDINKLAGALNSAPGARSKNSVDDILTVGAAGGLSSPLAAPVLAPVVVPAAAVVAPMEPPRPAPASKNMNVAIIAAALIIVGGGIVAAMIVKGRGGDTANPAMAANTSPNPTNAMPEAAPTPAPAPTAAPEAAPPPAPTAPPVAAPPVAAPTAANESPREHERPRERSNNVAAHAPSPTPNAAPSPSPTPAPTPAARPRQAAGGGSLDDLMNSVARPGAGGNNAAPAAAAAANLPEQPSRQDVGTAMRAVGAAVRACGTGSGGIANVTVIFNSQGRVNTATVAAPFAGTPTGSCAARAVRDAHVPAFSRATFSVTFPYPLN